MKIKTGITLLFLLIYGSILAQKKSFQYKRPLTNIHNQWHKIRLPDSVYSKINGDLSDLRIYGINQKQDTIEAAYIWEDIKNTTTNVSYDFKIINKVFTNKGQYITLVMSEIKPINKINLQLENKNFDWKLKLEGSNDNKQWFTITDQYRIINMDTPQIKYNYTDIYFSTASYKYFRIFINSPENLKLSSAKITNYIPKSLPKVTYTITNSEILQKKKTHQSIINLELATPVPVDELRFTVTNNFDYYRPITIQKISRISANNGSFHNIVQTIYTGTLSSLEKSHFVFDQTILNHIKVIINNNNNEKLSLENFKLQGSPKNIIVRFTDTTAKYALYYGNKKIAKPTYDIQYLKNKIPENLEYVTVGNETNISKDAVLKENYSLLNNTYLLWTIMGIIILVLGFFTLKMLQTKQ